MSPRATTTDYRGQRVLLVGLGLHGGGVATARWLMKQGAKLRVTDLKSSAQLAPSVNKLKRLPITWHLGGYKKTDWTWAQKIVINPDINPAKHPQLRVAERRGAVIENEASLFVKYFQGKTAAVTGTRGKTTTTTLLGAMLKRAHRQTIISGNVRQIPMLAYLPKTTSKTWAVLELSSFQLERLPVRGRSINVAVMTNLKVDHLSRHGSLKNYAQTKYNIFRGQTVVDFKILNWHDQYCRRAAKIGPGQTVWFGTTLPKNSTGVTTRNGWVVAQQVKQTKKLFPVSQWHLPGQHNLENLLAATAAARACGVSLTSIVAAVKTFSRLPYRQEFVRTYQGHRLINDSAATSPDATLAAMSLYPRGIYIIGGTDKELDLKLLAREIVRRNAATIFLPGTATKKIQSWLRTMNYQRPMVTVASMSSAIATALALAAAQQEIILSPGAASFGLFLHEFDRGDQFNQVVRQLR